MKGNKTIAEILKNEYGIKDLTPYEDITYELDRYTDEISRVKIQSKSGRAFCSPVYAIFDGYHMSWYGDYGAWVFDCTWKTDISNLAYNSPYYQLEKLVSRNRKEFIPDNCEKELLNIIRNGDWYKNDLDERQKNRFNEYIESAYDYIRDEDDVLYEYEELCEELREIKDCTDCESDWHYKVNNIDMDDYIFDYIFNQERYELYNIGQKEPGRFFIILYMLSVIAQTESEKGGLQSEN